MRMGTPHPPCQHPGNGASKAAVPRVPPASAPKTPAQQFGARLQNVREQAGESRAQLAAALQRDTSTVNRWENGVDDPSGTALLDILRHYSHAMAYLIDGKHGDTPTPTNPVLAEFLKTTTLGKAARKRGLEPLLAAIPFRNTPTLHVYARLTMALLPEYGDE